MKIGFESAEEEREFILSEGAVPVEERCDICGEKHYKGMGVYQLRKLNGYNLFCCKNCFDGNWDGWAPHHEEKLLKHLEKMGIKPPPRNEKGWLPREF